jgi:hypothetical protein
MAGYGAATTKEPLPHHWGDALAMLPEEAEELWFAINEAKMMANMVK